MNRLALGFAAALAGICSLPSVAQASDLIVAGKRTPTTAEQRRDARRRAREERFDERSDRIQERRRYREKHRDNRDHRLEDRRPDIEDYQLRPPRKGFYGGASLQSGVALSSLGFVPALGYRMELGGGLTDRFTLGVSGGLTGHQGIRKGVAGVFDLVAAAYPLYGLYVRGAIGVSSHAPVIDRLRKPGIGGFAGIGWEFRPLKRMAVSVGVDYDARVRTDGFYVQSIIAGVGLRAYIRPKKR